MSKISDFMNENEKARKAKEEAYRKFLEEHSSKEEQLNLEAGEKMFKVLPRLIERALSKIGKNNTYYTHIAIELGRVEVVVDGRCYNLRWNQMCSLVPGLKEFAELHGLECVEYGWMGFPIVKNPPEFGVHSRSYKIEWDVLKELGYRPDLFQNQKEKAKKAQEKAREKVRRESEGGFENFPAFLVKLIVFIIVICLLIKSIF